MTSGNNIYNMSKQKYRLKLHFSSALSLSIYYRHTTIDQLIQIEERNYISLTRTIANTLFPEYRDFLAQRRGGNPAWPADPQDQDF
jgi:hypothetical protein